MSYLDNFNVERIDSIPEVKQQLRFLRKAIDNNEIGNDSDAYRKPATGIPPTDLSQEVRNSLLKADNSVPTAISTTWSELKTLRDNSQLIPGCWYRITDYECTTSQAHTKSAGHKFDILVLATSVNTLSEEAKAIQNEGDYDGIYVDDGDHCVCTGRKVTVHFTNVTKELYFWHLVNGPDYEGYYSELSLEELKSLTQEQLKDTLWTWLSSTNYTVISEDEIDAGDDYDPSTWLENTFNTHSFDSYFSKCNLNAWKIWYCLDNDTNRFAWAADYELPEGFGRLVNVFEGGSTYIYMRYPQGDQNGKYAFVYCNYSDDMSLNKYIANGNFSLNNGDIIYSLIEQPTIDDILKSEDTEYYIVETSDKGKGVIYRMIDEWNNDCPYDFKNILFERYGLQSFTSVPSLNFNDANNKYKFPYGAYDLAGNAIINVTPVGVYYVHTFALKDLNSEVYYDYTVEAHRGLKNDEDNEMCCYNNIIQPATDETQSGNGFCAKMLNNCVFFNVYADILDPSTSDEYSQCSRIKLGNDCASFTFGINCYNISCKNSCTNWTCGNNCYNITCGNYCYNIILGNGCYSWTCGNHCYDFTCKASCFSWICGNNCMLWSILASNCYYWTCGNKCSDWTIVADKTRYFNLLSGCSGSGGILNLSTYLSTNKDYVQCVGKTTNGNIRVWNPADPSGT